jgi:L-threonylcarbamoyladenylate synthase
MILPQNNIDSIASADHCIRAGGLIGLPTETVYGLAANADDDAAVAQIFKAKGRPADHPLIVHVADASAVAHYATEVPGFAKKLMQKFWPGPLTLILPRRPGVADAAAGGHGTIGLRCPSHPVAQALLRQLALDDGAPVCGLAAPSANQFGRVSPTTAAHVQGEFGAELLILDGGPCKVGIESTIIDCSRGLPVLLRPGDITPAQIQTACGFQVLQQGDPLAQNVPSPKASGTLESHYAPRARVRLMNEGELQTALALLGSTTPVPGSTATIGLYSRCRPKAVPDHVACRRMPPDAVRAAQELFAVLRELDDLGVTLIWIESPPADEAWDGVRDRLQRAAC